MGFGLAPAIPFARSPSEYWGRGARDDPAVDLDRSSPTYGYITTTPKPGWAQADLCGAIQQALNVPVAFDTDVNAAAFGEHHWVEENRALDPLLYLTIGTGIGLGAVRSALR